MAVLLLGLAVWSSRLIIGVSKIRSNLDERTQWLHHAEQERYQIVNFAVSLALRNSDGTRLVKFMPERVMGVLTKGRARRSYPLPKKNIASTLTRWLRAEKDLLKLGEELDRWPKHDDRLEQQIQRNAGFIDTSISFATREVLRSNQRLADRLSSRWSALYALAGITFACLGALLFMLMKSRRQSLALHAQHRRFRTLVQTAQCLIWAVDDSGDYLFVNEAAHEIYRRDPATFEGQPFTKLCSAGHVESDRRMLDKVLAGEDCLNHETVHMRADGEGIHLIVNARPIRDRGRVTGAIGTAIDVTTLRTIQDRQARDERIRSLGALAGGIAHDFKNLLTVMAGQAELAKSDADTTESIARRLEAIMDTADRGRRLAEQLLGFARNQGEGSSGVIDLVAVVNQMRELIERVIPTSIKVETVLPDKPLRIEGDWSQIEQVIVNLVLNARDAMPEGGKLGIHVGRTTVGGQTCAMLEVLDTGHGMGESVRERIFEPFFTTKPPGEGSGLGLATVYNIVHKHSGTVAVESTPGRGSRFRVILPLIRAAVSVEKAATT